MEFRSPMGGYRSHVGEFRGDSNRNGEVGINQRNFLSLK